METLTAGFVVFINGITSVAGIIFSPLTAVLIVGALSLGWLAVIEIEELNKKATKPQTPLH